MKRYLLIGMIVISSGITGFGSDLSGEFESRYKSLEPRENSSVQSDYLFEQIALGSEYTIRLLDRMYTNDAELNEKVDELINRFDTLIEQNKKIIELLQKKEKN